MADSSLSLASQLALHFFESRTDPTKSSAGLIAEMEHRIQIVQFWAVTPGARVLELGCGQGDTTIALANAVGPSGHVDAVDPGSPEYGTPPLKDAQGHILASPLGGRINFHRATATAYVENYAGEPYDFIVMAHSIWYFENPSIFPGLVAALRRLLERAKGTRLCIAEWSLQSRKLSGVPHVWTALLRSLLEAKRPTPSGANIRAVLSPTQITEIVTGNDSGLLLVREEVKETTEGMKDGFWEVGYTLRKREADMQRLVDTGVAAAERVQAAAYFDALQSAVQGIGGVEGVKCMDFWVGVFGLS